MPRKLLQLHPSNAIYEAVTTIAGGFAPASALTYTMERMAINMERCHRRRCAQFGSGYPPPKPDA
jgi:hypothetical protein